MTGNRNGPGKQGESRGTGRDDIDRRMSAKDDVARPAKNRNFNKVRDASYGHGGHDTDGAGTSGNIEGFNAGGEPEERGGPSRG